jgi:hypothetical protein
VQVLNSLSRKRDELEDRMNQAKHGKRGRRIMSRKVALARMIRASNAKACAVLQRDGGDLNSALALSH